uniref:Aa_trans domain-containing protein n=2 Tax=Caenorhabditis tropicalis TaxID=1561998 RepID=A0A1I7TAU5_9PELO
MRVMMRPPSGQRYSELPLESTTFPLARTKLEELEGSEAKICKLILPEFPTVDHAGFVIRIFYSGFISPIILSIPVGILAYFLTSGILLLLIGISILVSSVFFCITSFFCKVYQLLMTFEMYKMHLKAEKPLNEQEVPYKEHRERSSLIKILYVIFIVKDMIVTPVIMVYEAFHSIFSILMNGLEAFNDLSGRSAPYLALIGIDIGISVLVMIILLLCFTKKHPGSNQTPWNPLQLLIISQAKLYFAIMCVSIVIGAILIVINFMTLLSITTIIRVPELMLPLIILITTTTSVRGRIGNFSAQPTEQAYLPAPPTEQAFHENNLYSKF